MPCLGGRRRSARGLSPEEFRTTSWDIGERLMREMMLPPPAAAPRTRNVRRAPPILESAVSTFMANMEGENRTETPSANIRLLFRELRQFADGRMSPPFPTCNVRKLVTFRKTWPQQGAATRNKQLDRLEGVLLHVPFRWTDCTESDAEHQAGERTGIMPDPFTSEEQEKILAKPQTAGFVASRTCCFTARCGYPTPVCCARKISMGTESAE